MSEIVDWFSSRGITFHEQDRATKVVTLCGLLVLTISTIISYPILFVASLVTFIVARQGFLFRNIFDLLRFKAHYVFLKNVFSKHDAAVGFETNDASQLGNSSLINNGSLSEIGIVIDNVIKQTVQRTNKICADHKVINETNINFFITAVKDYLSIAPDDIMKSMQTATKEQLDIIMNCFRMGVLECVKGMPQGKTISEYLSSTISSAIDSCAKRLMPDKFKEISPEKIIETNYLNSIASSDQNKYKTIFENLCDKVDNDISTYAACIFSELTTFFQASVEPNLPEIEKQIKSFLAQVGTGKNVPYNKFSKSAITCNGFEDFCSLNAPKEIRIAKEFVRTDCNALCRTMDEFFKKSVFQLSSCSDIVQALEEA